jgi:hypothetical protein
MKKVGKKSIVLLHEGYGRVGEGGYLINLMRPIWESWGCRMLEVQAHMEWPEAGGAFVHVDLTPVPEAFTEQAARYRFQWNVEARDITKENVCENLVRMGDGYERPVIVKTNLNHAGIPERNRIVNRNNRLRHSWRGRFLPGWCASHLEEEPLCLSKDNYRVFRTVKDVPPGLRESPDWVMQSFCCEPLEGGYALREYYFLGDAEYVRTEIGDDPAFTSGLVVEESAGSVPEELRALRRRLGLDYRKIDYVMKEGKPFVFDVNKTVGVRSLDSPAGEKVAWFLAWGLFPEWHIHRETCQKGVC